ncbi:MAG: leucine-rich repeat domain-containing protein, partial [Bdellovibrionota bacterium]
LTEELKAAKEGFDKALEHDQQTNTVTIGRNTIWKREFEVLESLARLNGTEIREVLHGIKSNESGQVLGLRLKNIVLSDISLLTSLTALERIDFGQNPLAETDTNKATLDTLKQQRCYVTGFVWPSECEKLERLAAMNHCNSEDVLKGILGTEYGYVTMLTIEHKQLTDITVLAELTALRGLYLKNNSIRELPPLASLTELRGLDLDGNNISDISRLAELPDLEVLFLGRNKITDITPLADLKALQGLILSQNQITDVTPLAGTTGLKTLSLDANPLSDISPLAGLPVIENLYLKEVSLKRTLENRSTISGLINQGCQIVGALP